MDTKWKVRWKHETMATKHEGVYRLKEGGFLVRALVVDPMTGKRKEVKKVMLDCGSANDAAVHLLKEKKRLRAGIVTVEPSKTPFADFAVSLRDEKVKSGKIKSAKNRSNKKALLEHL